MLRQDIRAKRITQRKGDVAVAQAIATFTRFGADVLFPFTESAAYDLAIDLGFGLKRLQVRFSTDKEVGLRRIHSNSKGYVIKIPKSNSFDWLYILNSKGVEFLITKDLGGRSSITPQTADTIQNVLPLLLSKAFA